MHIAITLGDPAGIGPEVVKAALTAWRPDAPDVQVTLVGPRNLTSPLVQRAGGLTDALNLDPFDGPLGEPSAASGAAALAAIHAAIDLADAGHVQALVTAPVSKQALVMAGGHD